MDYDHPQDLTITPRPFAASLPTAMSGHGETTPKKRLGMSHFFLKPQVINMANLSTCFPAYALIQSQFE